MFLILFYICRRLDYYTPKEKASNSTHFWISSCSPKFLILFQKVCWMCNMLTQDFRHLHVYSFQSYHIINPNPMKQVHVWKRAEKSSTTTATSFNFTKPTCSVARPRNRHDMAHSSTGTRGTIVVSTIH